MAGHIRVERTDTLATLTIDNPEKLNALDRGMWVELASALNQLATECADPALSTLRCLKVRGAGDRAFAAGGDLAEFLTARMDVNSALSYHQDAVAPALDALADFPLPVVAQIDGPCIGGGLEIACCCDIRIASTRSSFGAPIHKLGFNMYASELARVLSAIQPSVAAEILLEGRIFTAEEAFSKGLVSRVVAPNQLHDEVAASCRRIAQGAPLVARQHKHWMRQLRDGRTPNAQECLASLALVESADYREGLAAFLEKRAPKFTGR